MPTIVDYASLCQAIYDFTHRSTLSAYVDYFIQAAQEKITDDIPANNFGNYIRAQEAAFTGTITGGTVGVPTDWLAAKDLLLSDVSGVISPLEYTTSTALYGEYPDRNALGRPEYIARDGASFVFGPAPDSAYNVAGTYYSKAALLGGSTTSNWMITECPTLLLAACLIKSARFVRDADAIEMWKDEYVDKLSTLILRDKAERYVGGLAVQVV